MQVRRYALSGVRDIAGGGQGGSVGLWLFGHKLSDALRVCNMITLACPACRNRHGKAGRNIATLRASDRMRGWQPLSNQMKEMK